MNIMEKAQKRAILMIDSEYVFNDIYFTTEEGMTSTSAQHVSAMANVMVQDIKQHIMGLRLYEKSIRVIGDAEVTVETVNNTLPEIAESVKRICKANALIAWLREAVKEREQAQKYVSDMSLDDWMKKQGIEKPVSPEPPQMPRINFQDYATILDTGLSVKEYNRFVELNSALAVYGEMIHEKGLLTRQKSELARIMQNPTEVKESGRDIIITTYKVDVNISADIDNLYTELQSEYRKLQAEKNGIEAKFSNLAMDYQTRKNDEWKAAKAQYDRDLQKVNSELVGIQTQMKEWKKQRLEELAALKIIIPDALKPLYKELKVKYL
jgi:undecaprenyl pyrophosphate synthase